MKDKKTLLDAMANIDDAFIEEAAHPELVLKANRRAKRLRMLSSRRIGTLAACFVVAVGLMFAVPYLSNIDTMQEENSDVMDEILLSQALASQQSIIDSQNAVQEDLRQQEAQESARAAAEAEQKAEEESRKAAESMKLSEESMKAVGSDKKAQDEASQKAEEAIKSSSDSVKQTESDAATTSTVINLYTVDGVTYEFGAGVLYDAFADAEGIYVTDLVIPETLGGVTVEKLHTEFWSASGTWKTVTIPAGVTKFGDVSALSKSVTVICPEGSPAASFFKVKGYSVQTTQQ